MVEVATHPANQIYQSTGPLEVVVTFYNFDGVSVSVQWGHKSHGKALTFTRVIWNGSRRMATYIYILFTGGRGRTLPGVVQATG